MSSRRDFVRPYYTRHGRTVYAEAGISIGLFVVIVGLFLLEAAP